MITAKEATALVTQHEKKATALFLEQNLERISESIREAATVGKRELYIKGDTVMATHSSAVIAELVKQGFFAKLDQSATNDGYYLYITWGK